MKSAWDKIYHGEFCVNDFEGSLFVDYIYNPYHAAVFYLKNGDPEYPEEPAEAEILSVKTSIDGEDLREILSDKTISALEQEAIYYQDTNSHEDFEE
jgi:hypothetical protein